MDKLVDPLIVYLKAQPVEQQDGDLNYAITKIIRDLYPMRYFHQNRVVGVLCSILLEHYRTKIGPYEDKKILDNGDVV